MVLESGATGAAPSGSIGGTGGHLGSTTATTTTSSKKYPEAFYAHTHATPERSNRQRKQKQKQQGQHQQQQRQQQQQGQDAATLGPDPNTLPPDSNNSSSSISNHNDTNKSSLPSESPLLRRLHKMGNSNNAQHHSRLVGRLRAQQLNMFHNGATSASASASSGAATSQNSQVLSEQHQNQQQHQSPAVNDNDNNNANPSTNNTNTNTSDTTANNKDNNINNANKVTTTSNATSNTNTNANANATIIPTSHVHIITQAYGPKACIYTDILRIPPDMTSDRDIRIAYFRRGRQVLAEQPTPAAAAAAAGGDSDVGDTSTSPTSTSTSNIETTNTNNKIKKSVNQDVSQAAKIKFQAVSMAYEILSNRTWKESYDQFGLYGAPAVDPQQSHQSHQSQEEPPGNTNTNTSMVRTYDDDDDTNNHIGNGGKASDDTPLLMPEQQQPLYNQHLYNNDISSNDVKSSKPSAAPKLDNLRPSTTPPQPLRPSSSSNNNSNSSSKNGSNRKKSKRTRIVNTPNSLSYNNNTSTNGIRDNDDVSCVSQSTAGTATSRSSALRKQGSFFEKLSKTKASLKQQQQHVNNNANNGNPPPLPMPPTSMVRWNEEVEELIFRQDPDEVSFKARSAEEDEDYEAASSSVASLSSSGEGVSGAGNDNANGSTSEDYRPSPSKNSGNNAGPAGQSRVVYQKEPYPASSPHQQQVGGTTKIATGVDSGKNGSSSQNKSKVVLDTAELGTHLEKLDKVADSIADIFDELEASFDDLLGGSGLSTQSAQKQLGSFRSGNSNNKQMLPPSSRQGNNTHPSMNHQLQLQQQQQQQQAPNSRGEPQQGQQSSPKYPPIGDRQTEYDDASFHTPNISIGDSYRGDAIDQANTTMPTDALNLSKEEAAQVEEQAIALMREVTAMLIPPTNVVVKKKRSRHLHRQDTPASFGVASEAALSAGRELDSAPLQDEYDVGETRSSCESQGENATVATGASGVSLLDTQQHTNAPLKPAASTLTATGAKAGRRRLKTLQRRRQQKAKEQQQSLEENNNNNLFASSFWEGGDRNNQEHGDMFVDLQNTKKGSKKKQTEDMYFESLYQNFFAVPKERLPNEMVVRTKAGRLSCSVSTMSHSVATRQEPAVKLDFDAWDLANTAWPTMESGNLREDVRSAVNQQSAVRAKVETIERALHNTFDLSFTDDFGPDSTFDSGTAVDTTFDSSLADSAFTSTMELPDDESAAPTTTAMIGCESAPAAFLNQVFDVPLEAPLEFWCGEMRDAASTIASRKKNRALGYSKPKKQKKPAKPASGIKNDNTALDYTTDNILDNADDILGNNDDDDDGRPTSDDLMTLLDPPTHDSRIVDADASEYDDSTLNTLNTNLPLVEEDLNYRSGSGLDSNAQSTQPGSGSDPSMGVDLPTPEHTPALVSAVGETQSSAPRRVLVNVDTASESQYFHQDLSMCSEELAYSISTAALEEFAEERDDISREDISPDTTDVSSVLPDVSSGGSELETDVAESYSTISLFPAPSSLSLRRIGIDSALTPLEEDSDDQAFHQNFSSAASISSTVSKDKGDTSSFIAHLMAHLHSINFENPSLKSMKAQLSYGLESWYTTHEACMDAIVVSDDDLDDMLQILQDEVNSTIPGFMPKSSDQ